MSRRMPRADLTRGCRRSSDEHDPASSDPREFLGARFDAGLAWVYFPGGIGGLDLPRELSVAGRSRAGRGGRAAGGRSTKRHRDGHGGADDRRLRHRRAAAKVPAAVVHWGTPLLPAVQRAGCWIGPGRGGHPRGPRRRRLGRQRAEGVDVDGAARADGDPGRTYRPDGAQTSRPDLLLVRHDRIRVSTSGRCARSPARPSSTRSSSPMSGCPTPTGSAPRVAAGRSRPPR